MPTFYYTDGYGKEQEIIPEAISRTIKTAFHCVVKSSGNLVTLHRDVIKTKYTPEEIAEYRNKVSQCQPKL